ncbi:hypothetical protein OSTOST_24575, partial [Ostertagia ostertagi]
MNVRQTKRTDAGEPTGLRLHRGLRPFWVIRFLLWLDSLGSIARKILHPLLKFFYNNIIGLRLDSGERAMMCTRVLMAYSGKDFLIETSISRELANSFKGHKEL